MKRDDTEGDTRAAHFPPELVKFVKKITSIHSENAACCIVFYFLFLLFLPSCTVGILMSQQRDGSCWRKGFIVSERAPCSVQLT